MKELKRNSPVILVKLTLDTTGEVQLFWFQICAKFIKWRNIGFIKRVLLLVVWWHDMVLARTCYRSLINCEYMLVDRKENNIKNTPVISDMWAADSVSRGRRTSSKSNTLSDCILVILLGFVRKPKNIRRRWRKQGSRNDLWDTGP